MKRSAGFSWHGLCILALLICLAMNNSSNAFAGESGKKPPVGGPDSLTAVHPDFFRTWGSYAELTNWVKEQYPGTHPLVHYKGQEREMAVLFEGWSTGVRRTHFTIYHRANGSWKMLLVHNVIEKEELMAEKRADALIIKRKSGKTILILPD